MKGRIRTTESYRRVKPDSRLCLGNRYTVSVPINRLTASALPGSADILMTHLLCLFLVAGPSMPVLCSAPGSLRPTAQAKEPALQAKTEAVREAPWSHISHDLRDP